MIIKKIKVMKKLLFLLSPLVISLASFSQIQESDLIIINYQKIITDLEKHVNTEIREWQKQGKYENSAEYQNRVNSINREKKINEFTEKKINEIANEVINLNIREVEYDPDNEVYKLTFVGLPPIYMEVPISNQEAFSFEKNKNQLLFQEPIYTLTDTGFALLQLTIQNTNNWEKYQYSYLDNLTFKKTNVQITFEPVRIQIGAFAINTNEVVKDITIQNGINVDRDMPKTRMSQPNSVAIIIGNKNYQQTTPVDYALNDAESINNFLVNSLGYREGNILYKENISKADFEEIFGNQEFHEGRLFNMIKPNISDVFIYYSGHGAPGLRNNKGYFIPVECDPAYLEFRGYSLETFYLNLAKLPAKSVTVIVESCFSGENIHEDISSILPKIHDPVFMIPNGVLLSSSKATQPSCWYNDQEHGLFTYFLLRAIIDRHNSDTNNDSQLSFQEIFDYLSSQTEGIPYYARRLHAKEQHPTLQGNKEKILIEY